MLPEGGSDESRPSDALDRQRGGEAMTWIPPRVMKKTSHRTTVLTKFGRLARRPEGRRAGFFAPAQQAPAQQPR